jgi:hypothetical protein
MKPPYPSYTCLTCNHSWKMPTCQMVHCSVCGSEKGLYVKWTNYGKRFESFIGKPDLAIPTDE